MSGPWLLLQLADGTFPSGGFAHSNGLEAASVLGNIGVEAFLDASLRQAGRFALPFVRQAREDLARADDECDAMLLFRGPNQASRAQGRALVNSVNRVWGLQDLENYRSEPERPMHHAPLFGAVFTALGVSDEDTRAAYLHGLARGILSAGVRLGLLGPLEAQQLHAARAALMTDVLRETDPEPAQTAPLLEIYAALHERLDGRMFQS
ncbi:MAG: urease accessory UreF family protein [Labilithrix sp.]